MADPRRNRSRSRRPARAVAALALMLAPIAVAAAAYLTFVAGEDSGGPPAFPLAVGTPSARAVPDEPREPAPLIEGEPVPSIPLGGVDAIHVHLRKPPRAGLVFDLDTGEVLWRRRPLRVLPMASLTKIMTALVVVDETRAAEAVRITPAALHYEGSAVGLLPKGRRVRLETLLNGLLIVSGNDAAIALAVHVAGSEGRFVDLMNRRAREWGLECTHFASSHGLEDGNRSCPRDLAVLTRLAMDEPAHPPHRAPAPGRLSLPHQGRQALPDRPQPADPAGLPRSGGPEDRLHGRGRALLRGSGAPRRPPPGGGAAQLPRPRQARAEAARRGLRAGVASGASRTRTGGPLRAKEALFQLSYGPSAPNVKRLPTGPCPWVHQLTRLG